MNDHDHNNHNDWHDNHNDQTTTAMTSTSATMTSTSMTMTSTCVTMTSTSTYEYDNGDQTRTTKPRNSGYPLTHDNNPPWMNDEPPWTQ